MQNVFNFKWSNPILQKAFCILCHELLRKYYEKAFLQHELHNDTRENFNKAQVKKDSIWGGFCPTYPWESKKLLFFH